MPSRWISTLAFVAACLAALPAQADSNASTSPSSIPQETRKSPLSELDLALILTDETRTQFNRLEQELPQLEAAYGKLSEPNFWLTQDLDPRSVMGIVIQTLSPRFQRVRVFDLVEDALENQSSVILSFNMDYSLGVWPGEKTEVSITGDLMDSEQNEIDLIEATGMYWIPKLGGPGSAQTNMLGSALSQIVASELGTSLPMSEADGYSESLSRPYEFYTPGFKMALGVALKQWADRMENSPRLRRFLRTRSSSVRAATQPAEKPDLPEAPIQKKQTSKPRTFEGPQEFLSEELGRGDRHQPVRNLAGLGICGERCEGRQSQTFGTGI